MKARELYQAGKLNEAIQSLQAELRDNPTDVARRTFLFELLCFAGEYDRAEKHLDILRETPVWMPPRVLFSIGRRSMPSGAETAFSKKAITPGRPRILLRSAGLLMGSRLKSIEDADSRIGPRLEVFAAGRVYVAAAGARRVALRCRRRNDCAICCGFRPW